MAADGHLGITALSRITLASAGLPCMYSQRCQFPAGSWVWARPLLRVHPIVDPTKFWESVGVAHIKNTAPETTTEIRHY